MLTLRIQNLNQSDIWLEDHSVTFPCQETTDFTVEAGKEYVLQGKTPPFINILDQSEDIEATTQRQGMKLKIIVNKK